ncbi:MAG: hypothetical protein M3O09_03240 [Acidobacteriota bacterium]|nr:hypothetical protein [Acidobacteriota bacterium]
MKTPAPEIKAMLDAVEIAHAAVEKANAALRRHHIGPRPRKSSKFALRLTFAQGFRTEQPVGPSKFINGELVELR